jgi:hypothetical protein
MRTMQPSEGYSDSRGVQTVRRSRRVTLTPRQARFVLNYVFGSETAGNGAAAARAAGYSAHTAKVQAAQLLSLQHVSLAIQIKERQLVRRAERALAKVAMGGDGMHEVRTRIRACSALLRLSGL